MFEKTIAKLINDKIIEKNRFKFFASLCVAIIDSYCLIYFLYKFYYFFKILTSRPKTPEALWFQIYVYLSIAIFFLILVISIYFTIKFEHLNRKYVSFIQEKILEDKETTIFDFSALTEIDVILSKNYDRFDVFIKNIEIFSSKKNKLEKELLNLKKINSLDENIKKNLEEITINKNREIDSLNKESLKFLNENYFDKNEKLQSEKQNILDQINVFSQKFVIFQNLSEEKILSINEIEKIRFEIYAKLLKNGNHEDLKKQFLKYEEFIQSYHTCEEKLLLVDKYVERNEKHFNRELMNEIRKQQFEIAKKRDSFKREIDEIENSIKENNFYKINIENFFSLDHKPSDKNVNLIKHSDVVLEYKKLCQMNDQLTDLIQKHLDSYRAMLPSEEELFNLTKHLNQTNNKNETKQEIIINNENNEKNNKKDNKLSKRFSIVDSMSNLGIFSKK